MSMKLSKDIWQILLSFVAKEDRLNVLCTCKSICNTALSYVPVFQPWMNGSKGLIHACEKGFVPYFQKWSKLAVEIPFSALHEAVENNHPEIVSLLLADPRVDPTDEPEGYSLVAHACFRGYGEILRLLIDDGRVELSVESNEEEMALYSCLTPDTLTHLLGASWMNKRSVEHAFFIACEEGLSSLIPIYLLDPRIEFIHGEIVEATSRNHPEILALLLQDPRSRRAAAKPSLDRAIKRAAGISIVLLQQLLEHGFGDPDADNTNAVRRAVKKAKPECVEILLKDPRVRDLPPDLISWVHERPLRKIRIQKPGSRVYKIQYL